MNNLIDGLYISGVWICDAEFTLTFQGNDLTRPDERTASYSNTFTLPDSLTVRDLLENAEQIDSGGAAPYRQLPAKVIDEGEVIFSGVIEFVSFSAGWKVNLYDSFVNFFDALKDKKLQDLDLGSLDHEWTLKNITALAGSSEGVVYPLIDYGGIEAGTVPYDTLTPAVYVKTIFGQICKETDFKPVGNWLNDELFTRLALPFVGADPKSHDSDWIKENSARVAASADKPIQLRSGKPIDMLLPLTTDGDTSGLTFNGDNKPYKNDRYVYVCKQNMHVKVVASVKHSGIIINGAPEVRLIVERNGKGIGEGGYFSKGGMHDYILSPETLSVEETVDCVAGDELAIRLTGSSRTKISNYNILFTISPSDMYAGFEPDASIRLGDLWPVAPNLPDLSCKDLVLSLAKMMCGTFVVDNFRRTIRLSSLDDTVKQLPQARDWSECVSEDEEPQLTPGLEPYGQYNACKWAESDEKKTKGFGDGSISSASLTSPNSVDLFELPFQACVQSGNDIAGYGKPVYIKTREITGTKDNQTIRKLDAKPRLILVEPTKTVSVSTKVINVDGLIEEVPVTLNGCWFAIRPAFVRMNENNYSLAFAPVPEQSEQPLIDRYFKALKRILRRPRTLEISMYLQPSDVASLDLSIPIRLQAVRAGSLDLNDNYFYLNRVNSYRSGRTCKATLIAL